MHNSIEMLCLPDEKRQNHEKTKLTGCPPNVWRQAELNLNVLCPRSKKQNEQRTN